MAKAKDQKDAVKRLKEARQALHDNSEKELKAARAQGRKTIPEETPEYQRLNRAVLEAEKEVSWWRR
jgi:hypothetical protein